MTKLRIGMISFAHSHAFSYLHELMKLSQIELVGIADDNKSRVDEIISQYNIPYYADYKKLLASDVEAIIICSENVHHAKLTIEAAEMKKHVLCEKPLGISIAEMEQMIAVCRNNDVQLMTAFPCRFIPAVIQAKEAIDRGDIGRIVAIKGTNRGTMPGGWFIDKTLSGGGAVLDHTVHVTDLMHYIMDAKVEEVYAQADTLFHDIDIDDTGMVHMKFDNGVIAVLDTSWSRPKSFPIWGDVTMEIIGTKGAISINSFAQKNEIYSDEKMKAQWSYWGDNMDEYLVKAFVEAIRQGHPVPITGEDGLKATTVALLAYESVKQRKSVRVIH
jgi:myo-inositol 2-dehydrogenase/D-chiro-inositol 1-dehydrogenase